MSRPAPKIWGEFVSVSETERAQIALGTIEPQIFLRSTPTIWGEFVSVSETERAQIALGTIEPQI